jgi:nucleotide-binding universal stress UspA family protein
MFKIDMGHPAEQIVRVAERENANLIVMGRRGKTTIERWMLGSVSERVLRYAHGSVLVVR